MALIEVQNVIKKYKNKYVIDDISFKVDRGDVIGFVGENGAGKSTLMSMIVTLIKPTSGQIYYKGQNIIKKPNLIRGKIGYVPQDIALYQELSGMDNLKYWARTYHLRKSDLKEAIDNVINIIGLDEASLKKRVYQYSGGMKRRLNIGVALLNNPDVIVMDEPTVGIDIISKNEILKVIKNLNNAGKTILYIAHDFEEIEQICNKLCIIKQGKVIEFADIRDITDDDTVSSINLTKHYIHRIQGN